MLRFLVAGSRYTNERDADSGAPLGRFLHIKRRAASEFLNTDRPIGLALTELSRISRDYAAYQPRAARAPMHLHRHQ